MKTKIVVAWHNAAEKTNFCESWRIEPSDSRVRFQHDKTKMGCAGTKNIGIETALDNGAEIIIVLDDDCIAHDGMTLDEFIDCHIAALEPQPVELFEAVTDPPSRGTPYFNRSITMPVAASIGFWTGVGDYDAPGQLVHGATEPMEFRQGTIFGRYFPFSGMNFAFRREWAQCAQLVNIARWDDIFMGYIWQKVAYAKGYCFNLNGPLVHHSRQSDVFANLRDEAPYFTENETLWQRIAEHPSSDYDDLVQLLPG